MMDTPEKHPIAASGAAGSRPKWPFLALAAALAVVALLGYGMVLQGRGQVTGGPAPDFTLATLDGHTFRLAEQRGTPVIINFWASWCIPCRTEMRLLEATSRTYQDGVQFVGVAYVDNESAARAFLEEYDVTYPNGLDLGTRISDAYRIKGVPETFFVDREGRVIGFKIGPLTEPELKGWIAQLLE